MECYHPLLWALEFFGEIGRGRFLDSYVQPVVSPGFMFQEWG